MRVNWSKVLKDGYTQDVVLRFANNELSRDDFLWVIAGNEGSGQVRKMVRSNGAQLARRIARKALRRRNLMS